MLKPIRDAVRGVICDTDLKEGYMSGKFTLTIGLGTKSNVVALKRADRLIELLQQALDQEYKEYQSGQHKRTPGSS